MNPRGCFEGRAYSEMVSSYSGVQSTPSSAFLATVIAPDTPIEQFRQAEQGFATKVAWRGLVCLSKMRRARIVIISLVSPGRPSNDILAFCRRHPVKPV